MCFQHDVAPAHCTNGVSGFLDEIFGNRWIGRGGPIAWPPRSSELNPLDFDRVFVSPVNDLPDLGARIRETIATVPKDMLERTWQEIEYRFDIVRAINGAHVEVY
ncbi:hypothetical protein B7P43_G17057 [Cryptotermes secundus]|uniref:Uncharacterized protein n=1 Tax=Cryptotermes secundus TaxID=105785 RepID=A0A2J7RT45_9NEOP|nr:hypothetical protein B7P43_G17057 [Cryptotermes secundus]